MDRKRTCCLGKVATDWPAAGFVDGQLSFHSSFLEGHAAYIANGRVTTPWVVEPLNVVELIGACLFSGPVDFSPVPFGFQRREEALHGCVVPDIA